MEPIIPIEFVDDNVYFTNITPRPPNNTKYGDFICEKQVFETNCSYIYIGHKISKENKSEKVVFKFIKRIKGLEKRIDNEIDIINQIKYIYIIEAAKTFTYRQFYCLITKFAPYESLYHFITNYNKRGIPEHLAIIAMRQMLKAVQTLHKNGIWHRDIKPENFLVYSWDPDPILVVLSDFGFAQKFPEGTKSEEYVGSPDYVAPEIYLKTPYTNSIDVWSLGITLFFMLTNKHPFPKYNFFPNDCMNSIKQARLNMEILQYNNVSIEAIDLITNMCKLDPNKRYTIDQALSHSWFSVPEKATPIERQYQKTIIRNNEIEDG